MGGNGEGLSSSGACRRSRVDKGLTMLCKESRNFLRMEVLMGLESEGGQSSFRKKLVGERERLDLELELSCVTRTTEELAH